MSLGPGATWELGPLNLAKAQFPHTENGKYHLPLAGSKGTSKQTTGPPTPHLGLGEVPTTPVCLTSQRLEVAKQPLDKLPADFSLCPKTEA